ncbi:MAG TPA: EamA family transporter [Flavobacteriales bacterium]|mgnify:CR=1 FL=1|jgi:drug/metabolite transporter (DMT)-like permease|nr:EamA family transporter [Flavobacteriales bacterium]
MTDTRKAHLALFIVNLVYGINYSVAKDVMPEYIQPFGFILIRVVSATVLFWIFQFILGANEKVARKDFLTIALAGVFGIAANQLLFFKGLSMTTPINASIVMTTTPVIVLIIASLWVRQIPERQKILGVFFGISGALMLLTFRAGSFAFPDFSQQTVTGDVLVLTNATAFSIYLVIVKPIMKRYKPITVIKWAFLFGSFYVFPFGYQEFRIIDWSSITPLIWGEIAFVVLATTFLVYLLNVYGLKRLNPETVSVYIYLQPFFASMVALALGKDSLTWIKLVSVSLVFIGVYLVSFKKS